MEFADMRAHYVEVLSCSFDNAKLDVRDAKPSTLVQSSGNVTGSQQPCDQLAPAPLFDGKIREDLQHLDKYVLRPKKHEWTSILLQEISSRPTSGTSAGCSNGTVDYSDDAIRSPYHAAKPSLAPRFFGSRSI